jgi:pimeloyl-ACP methyl ester carboxylesterase
MGEYITINGHPTWVDQAGSGPPVLLLHGGFTNGDGMFELFAPLAEDHTLISFDRRGHGRTADTEGAFHYADMAKESIGVLEHAGGQPADLIGWSDGGNTAMLVALSRPDLVRSLVLIGANYHCNGLMSGVFDDFGPDSELVQSLAPLYAERSPDGVDHYGVVVIKGVTMILSEPTMTTEDLARIPMPALVLVGDDDAVLPEHTWSLYESLPSGQLAVIPGASHIVPYEKPELVVGIISDFIRSEGAVETMMPIRRAVT